MNEVVKMVYEVNEADVTRAKNHLKASLLFMQDSSQREQQQRQGLLACRSRGAASAWHSTGAAAVTPARSHAAVNPRSRVEQAPTPHTPNPLD